MPCGGRRVVVLVLGDLGHSPRMLNHAVGLAACAGVHVDLVGYSGSTPPQQVLDCANITIHYVGAWRWRPLSRPLYLLSASLKVLFQVLHLLFTLLVTLEPAAAVLVQNPPAIPALCVARLACWLRGSRLAIDWHNFGHTILAMNLGTRHPIVRLAYWYERAFGRLGDFHFCVTRAMQEELASRWNIVASLLYDRAPERFRRLSPSERRQFFLRMQQQNLFEGVCGADSLAEDSTLVATLNGAGKEPAPAIIVSSTSYTADEDFGVLLDAIRLYEETDSSRRLLVIITGKGPQKQMYKEKIASLNLRKSDVIQAWLTAEDYPLLLGSADLGVSLHTSSSGLDLPMKVVDMFGCGLPVCAINFSCLPELVLHNYNGLVFETSQQLSDQINRLVSSPEELQRLASGVAEFRHVNWLQAWERSALPHFVRLRSPSSYRFYFMLMLLFLIASFAILYLL